jgi:methionyl-tRNA formyltransferase
LKVFGPRRSWRDAAPDDEPGTIVAVESSGPDVACGVGAVRLIEVQPDGKQRMDGAGFVNGYRPEVGEQLGTD